MSFFKIIRPVNLLLVAFTQILIYLFVFVDLSSESSTPLLLSPLLFLLLILDTVLIAAGGYVINDILDDDIDQINKGNKQILGRLISKKNALHYYRFLLLLGAMIALFIAISIHNIPLFIIYPVACFLLFGYSCWWKKMPWIGNVVVSLFTAFVPFILLFAERQFYFDLAYYDQVFLLIKIGGFMLFAFLLNLIREIIKDIEDKQGDQKLGYRTAAIVFSLNTVKNTCYVILVVNFIAICYLTAALPFPDITPLAKYICISVLAIMHGYISFKINYAFSPSQFHKVSTTLKITMLIGLVYFISL